MIKDQYVHMQNTTQTITEAAIWLTAAGAGRRPRIGPLRAGVGAGRFQHGEWQALLSRFVQQGGVDYSGMSRVRRLVEIYLSRLAHENPDAFADSDDQLAFYLNAYNAIAIHQIIVHYPVASIRDIPGALTRVYPIGRYNVSLQTLHGNFLRAFGEPRIHAALHPAAYGNGPLLPTAFTGITLQAQLGEAMRTLLADPVYGARFDAATRELILPAIFKWYGGDFVQPQAMPGVRALISRWMQPRTLISSIRMYLPPTMLPAQVANIRFRLFDWRLNDQPTTASGRTITAY